MVIVLLVPMCVWQRCAVLFLLVASLTHRLSEWPGRFAVSLGLFGEFF